MLVSMWFERKCYTYWQFVFNGGEVYGPITLVRLVLTKWPSI